MEFSLEEIKPKIKDFRPIDDVFFELLAANKEVCEEILRTILEDTKLIVEDVIVQSSERNIYGRSVRLDALCTLGNGSKCNIEVQRANNDDHLRRARFNAASITVKESAPGDKFKDVVNVCIVYISEFDFLNKGKTIYHIDKTIRETKDVIDDGLTEIFVNTVINDGTDIADLMSCFTKTDVNNPKFPKLSSEVKRLKNTEGGLKSMCDLMQKYNQEAVDKKQREIIKNMIKEKLPFEQIARIVKISIEDVEKIANQKEENK